MFTAERIITGTLRRAVCALARGKRVPQGVSKLHVMQRKRRPGAPHEATLLKLDCSKARSLLGWRPVWGFTEMARHTAEWYRRYYAEGVADSARQLDLFRSAAAGIWSSDRLCPNLMAGNAPEYPQ